EPISCLAIDLSSSRSDNFRLSNLSAGSKNSRKILPRPGAKTERQGLCPVIATLHRWTVGRLVLFQSQRPRRDCLLAESKSLSDLAPSPDQVRIPFRSSLATRLAKVTSSRPHRAAKSVFGLLTAQCLICPIALAWC